MRRNEHRHRSRHGRGHSTGHGHGNGQEQTMLKCLSECQTFPYDAQTGLLQSKAKLAGIFRSGT
jgi:hypothetical protein